MRYSELNHVSGCGNQSGCTNLNGCENGAVAAICIKRHDTQPSFRTSVEDCDGPMDLTDSNLVLEYNLWSRAKLKKSITNTDDTIAFADNIGFGQVMQHDVIIVDSGRLPEHMLVIGFDEENKLIKVQRGYNGTTAISLKKGTGLRSFRSVNGSAEIETVLEDVVKEDGTVLKDQVVATYLVVNWSAEDTCLPGCFWLEFKLIKMTPSVSYLSSSAVISNFTPSTNTPADFGCDLGDGMEWVRRFPVDQEGFLINVVDSPTAEMNISGSSGSGGSGSGSHHDGINHYVSDTEPASPASGDFWFNTTTLKLYVYFNDGSSVQWVEV